MGRSQKTGASGEGAQQRSPASVASGLRQGESAAVVEVEQRVRRILAFRGYGIPVADRADLEQEVMTQVWQAVNGPGFDVRAGFWGFVELVASRRCIDWLRGRRQTLPLDELLPDLAATPAETAIGRERLRLAAATVAALDPPCKELIHLHAGLGKSYGEISRMLGRKEGALRTQMHRCIGSARKILARLSQADDRAESGERS